MFYDGKAHKGAVTALDCSIVSNRIYSGGSDGNIVVWERKDKL